MSCSDEWLPSPDWRNSLKQLFQVNVCRSGSSFRAIDRVLECRHNQKRPEFEGGFGVDSRPLTFIHPRPSPEGRCKRLFWHVLQRFIKGLGQENELLRLLASTPPKTLASVFRAFWCHSSKTSFHSENCSWDGYCMSSSGSMYVVCCSCKWPGELQPTEFFPICRIFFIDHLKNLILQRFSFSKAH